MVDLLSSNGFINIIVVVNHLIKMQYIIPINLINTISVAKYFVGRGGLGASTGASLGHVILA